MARTHRRANPPRRHAGWRGVHVVETSQREVLESVVGKMRSTLAARGGGKQRVSSRTNVTRKCVMLPRIILRSNKRHTTSALLQWRETVAGSGGGKQWACAWREVVGVRKHQRGVMRRVITRLQTTLASRVIAAWLASVRDRGRKRALLARAVARLGARGAARAMARRRALLTHAVARLTKRDMARGVAGWRVVARMLGRRRGVMLGAPWGGGARQWLAVAGSLAHRRSVMLSVVGRLRNVVVAQATGGWRDASRKQKRHRTLLAHALTRFVKRELSIAWGTWRGGAKGGRRRRGVMRKVVARMRNALVAQSVVVRMWDALVVQVWGGWRGIISEGSRRRAVLSRVAVAGGIGGWRAVVRETRRKRALLSRVVLRLTKRDVTRAMAQWRAAAAFQSGVVARGFGGWRDGAAHLAGERRLHREAERHFRENLVARAILAWQDAVVIPRP
ncbi:hypothetical protein T484DRAFT_1802810 [Baffinella frigidus]|nr:hypothetical protein T484DRAFT_1802810 [Cryptophyta sp. CCMP2293]